MVTLADVNYFFPWTTIRTTDLHAGLESWMVVDGGEVHSAEPPSTTARSC